MRIFVIADTHFNHRRLLEIGNRPTDYEARIDRAWRRGVGDDDVVIHAGDVAVGDDAAAHARLAALPGRKWLVLGNHDRRSFNWYLSRGWNSVSHGLRLELFGHRILVTHLPAALDGWFTLNIHGHLHGDTHRHSEFAGLLTERHCLVALERTGYSPVLLSSLVERFDAHMTDRHLS